MRNHIFANRKFLPVGQGAFYCEKFIDTNETKRLYTMVYDCGTSSGSRYLEKCIKKIFLENEIIDAIYISHFDNDHINGIEKLLKWCTVKNIYIPYLSKDMKLIYNFCFYLNNENGSFAQKLLNNPRDTINDIAKDKEMIKIYQITNSDETNETEDGTNIVNLNKCKNLFPSSNNCQWEFIPYNYVDNEKYKRIVKLLKQELKIKHITDFYKLNNIKYFRNWEVIKFAFKKIYIQASNCINNTSMLLYSGSKLDKKSQYLINCQLNSNCIPCCMFNYRFCNSIDCNSNCRYQLTHFRCPDINLCMRPVPSGCLYTGDISFKINCIADSVTEYYKNYIPNIGVLQVPHHGSSCNAPNDIFLSYFNNRHFLISAGGAKHPTNSIVKTYEKYGLVHVATTSDVSEITFRINL